ncbi:membrane-spanning 4-domains subfamily A member 8-like isoform X2 [Hyla sarda]|uniref:membrane-spanning 4-domains subfamily A member 8-like isoform X2 n=1 Tax=Hyla sarda TaxID=327740 RepID=UPI0024C44737|nr:membrane-spanning 4-domains subfamily A member 8-like isoform X2 [Hyla sarda]
MIPNQPVCTLVPASTMSTTNNGNLAHTNETLQNQAPTALPTYQTSQNQGLTAVPNWNTQVPPFLQNAPPPFPAYNAAPSAQMWTIPTVAPQYSLATVVAPNTDPSSPFYQTFLKGKPRALGIVLIVSAILEIALGITLIFTIFTITLPSGIVFWGSIFYIIAGSLTIAAHAKPSLCLVKGSLSLNIISSITSIVAIILTIVDLGTTYCYYYWDDDHTDYYFNECLQRLGGVHAVLSIHLIINLLLFCVSLSLSIFGCRSLSTVSSNGPQMFLIQNNGVVSMNPSTVPATFSGVAQPFPTANAPPPPTYVFSEAKARPMS